MARARVLATTLVAALLAVAAAMAAAAGGGGGRTFNSVPLPCMHPSNSTISICDTANCGKGNCSEVPAGPILDPTASYKCTCDPGWSQPKLFNVILPTAPCIIPTCSFSSDCMNITMPPTRGIPLTDPCAIVNCGQGGHCEKGAGASYQCRCKPGFRNFLNITSMPCIDDTCTFGADCAKLGLVNTPAAPAPAPVADDLY